MKLSEFIKDLQTIEQQYPNALILISTNQGLVELDNIYPGLMAVRKRPNTYIITPNSPTDKALILTTKQ
jgi:hypothetical protein